MSPRLKKHLWLVLRVVVSALCLGYVMQKTQWTDAVGPDGTVVPGFLHIFGDVFTDGGWPWFIAAIAVYVLVPVACAWRWRMLLGIQGVPLGLGEATRLTFISFFFNTFMPGNAGGDIVKAWYIARRTERKAEAVATVFLDRAIGMFSMALLCLGTLTFFWHDPALSEARVIILAFLGVAAAGSLVFFSRRTRRVLHVDALIARLPFKGLLARIDQAVFTYRDHRRTVLRAIVQSWCAHAFSMASIYFCALALGLSPNPAYFVIYMPVIWIVSAFVPAIGALGVIEGLCQRYFTAAILLPAALLGPAGSEKVLALALAMALLYRAAQFFAVLPGGVLNVLHPEVSLQEAERQVEVAEQADG